MIQTDVERLLAAAPAPLPLTRAALRPLELASDIQSDQAAVLFSAAPHPHAALAGLLLRLGHWERSHTVAQDIASPEGSYWHAIVHRMEPDPGNAAYWFRQTGVHPVFPKLLTRAEELLRETGPAHWHLKTAWDPFLFVNWCEEARRTGGAAETAATRIQLAEWHLLFDWCAG
ncbi:MAG: hypothetical protein JO270_17110 [Acidobacteriaceae bacterium]|nr:hypothetical protein [Acidobacteriaceae bacterium]